MERGLIQVYTGDGKGKTTAAIGQGIRACGRGLKVSMVQFLKSTDTGELNALKRLEPDFKLYRFEEKRGFIWNLNEKEINELREEVNKAFGFVEATGDKGECDVLILDEIMAAMGNGLLDIKRVVDFLKSKPEKMEVILTGRNVPKEIMDLADYISEIAKVKHPFEKGIGARKGIEF
jgi:cob(I)alamin adenosyltransferase